MPSLVVRREEGRGSFALEAARRDDGAMLAIDALGVRVAGRTIVDRVSFEAARGEIVAIIGPNGAGKTTLLEAIVGVRPCEGRVVASGRALASFRDRAATFAFAPDDVAPPPEALVAALVDHARRHRPRAPEVLARLSRDLGIDPLRGRSPGLLSRGERKRVALYLALAADRPVVVLDEPFGAFDPLQLRDVLPIVRSIADGGVTVLVSVHQLADAERIADRVLLLAAGRRVAFGTIDALRAQTSLPAGSLDAIFVALLDERRRAS
jgi:ABC-2 type transport system ATP-binding protein